MNYFKTLRLNAGLSQRAVSDKLGYTSSQFVSNWERGLCGFPPSKISKAAKIFGTTPTQLINQIVYEYRMTLVHEATRNRKVAKKKGWAHK